MAAIHSSSSLHPRQPTSPMMAGVAAAIAEEMAANPDAVPTSVLEKAKDWLPPSMADIRILGRETRAAGWRHGRLPGLRDIVGEFHPVMDRMIIMARKYEDTVTAQREAALQSPANSADLCQAVIYRWPYWFGVDANLGRVSRDPKVYLERVCRDHKGRLVTDPDYTGQAYDADHCADELLRQVLDVTLIDWISLLETLLGGWPAMFDAVWRRDAGRVQRLLRENRRMPDMQFLRAVKDPRDKFRAVVALFWEAERFFELMFAIGGPSRVMMTKLMAALGSTSMLAGAVAADSPTGRYVGSMWCHRGALALLFGDGMAMGHNPRHPHWSFGPGGDANMTDEIEGCVSEPALDLAGFNARTAPPFVLDSRLRDVQGEEPAQFFAGRDVRLLAIRFLLEVRDWLGWSKGRKQNQSPPLFDILTDSAIGRLALLPIARICPATGWSILREAVDATTCARKKKHPATATPPFPVSLGDVVANPRRWETLHGNGAPAGSVAARSKWFGDDFLAGMVAKARHEPSQFVTNDPTTIGHTICFMPAIWFDPYRETDMLRLAWDNVGLDHEIAFPGCFDSSIPADELQFCLRAAARGQVSATDMMRDPHARKHDCVRSPNRGRGGNHSATPPPAPLTANERLSLARFIAANKGGPLNQTIH